MRNSTFANRLLLLLFFLLGAWSHHSTLFAQAGITPDMVFNLSGLGRAYDLFDGNPATQFEPKHFAGFMATPAAIILRMKPEQISPCGITKIRFEAAPDAVGTVQVFYGAPGTGNWTPLSPQPNAFGNGVTAWEWYPVLNEVHFLKFIFEKPGELLPQNFKTGEVTITASGDCFYSDETINCPAPADCAPGHLTGAQKMGVNNFVGKSQLYYQMAPFENVREYMPWDHIQGHPSSPSISANSLDQPFRFSPAYPGYEYDRYFSDLHDFGRDVLGTFKESSPFQAKFNYNGESNAMTMNQLGMSFNSLGSSYMDLLERKPGNPTGGVAPNSAEFNNPQTYKDHARALYHLSARYGRISESTAERSALSAQGNSQGIFSFIENWNEQDKWWMQPAVSAPVNKQYEQRLAYFTPLEYMAMTYADRFQGGNALGAPLVMSGISEFDATYVRGAYMAWWELTGEEPAQNFPFYALNLHHYSMTPQWENGIMPEGDPQLQPGNPASQLNQIIAFRNKYLPNQQIWVTEFGYSDHPEDNTAALPHYPNPDMEEVQAQWLVRNFLLFNYLGVDRAYTYQLTDDGPNAWHGMFNHTGVIDRTDNGSGIPAFRYKKAWYYLFALRNILKDQYLKNTKIAAAQDGRPVWEYAFENEDATEKVRAIWIPQDENPGFSKYKLTVAPGAKIRIVSLANGAINGLVTEMEDLNGDGAIWLENVGERPVFVQEGMVVQPLDCACSVPLSAVSNTAAATAAVQALTGETAQIAADNHPHCNYGSNATSLWTGQSAPLLLNIGGGAADDEWLVEGLYLQDPSGQEGDVTIDFLDKNGTIIRSFQYGMNGQALYPFNATGYQYVWKRFENLQIKATTLRISKASSAVIGELVVCARSLATCLSDGQVPVAPMLSTPILNGNKIAFEWTMPNNADFASFNLQILDGSGNVIGQPQIVFSNKVELEVATLPCGQSLRLQVAAKDCEGLLSTPTIVDFETPDCGTGPSSAQNCDCVPIPLNLPTEHVYYELANGQQIPASAWTGDPCLDAVPDKSPFRMVDEQDLVGVLCEEGYDLNIANSDYNGCAQNPGTFPKTEWFPGWPSAAAAYPFKAILHFEAPKILNGIYLYDGNDQGKLSIEYRKSATAPWLTLPLPDGKNYITRNWHKWVKVYFDGNAIEAADLRVTLKDEKAHFAEIALCQSETIRKDQISKNAVVPSAHATDRAAPAATPMVFPNPVNDVLWVEPNGLAFSAIHITDVNGRLLRTIAADPALARYSIDLQDFAKGVYLVTFLDATGAVWRTRVVRQ